jgi:hypothetical protein
MNRFAICTAFYLYATAYNHGGFTARCHHQGRGILAQLNRMKFRPSPLLSLDSLRYDDYRDDYCEEREIYLSLVRRWEGEKAANWEQESLS